MIPSGIRCYPHSWRAHLKTSHEGARVLYVNYSLAQLHHIG